MTCGTGKTSISLRIAEKILPANTNPIFIAPSIALVSESLDKLLTAQTERGAPKFDLAIVGKADCTARLLDERE